jgi:hypothetical protein
MVAFTLRNDTVENMDIGDEDGDSGGSRTTNPPSSSLANAKKRSEIRTFSYHATVGLGNFVQRCGEESGTRDVKAESWARLSCLYEKVTFISWLDDRATFFFR